MVSTAKLIKSAVTFAEIRTGVVIVLITEPETVRLL